MIQEFLDKPTAAIEMRGPADVASVAVVAAAACERSSQRRSRWSGRRLHGKPEVLGG